MMKQDIDEKFNPGLSR